ncbi:MAG: CobQ/CobB/MinD/ParA nucleotide binding domain-containing protein [Anaerolineae bacterium]|nr:MAG: CobQ/CobB/MinD/ParA nucleotide binding domain-containing protein [Anaerolineae bacterium]
MADKIRVVIVDDIAETRENIRKLLQFEPDVEVVGVARTGKEGIQVAMETQPDVMLMDINMPDMDGISATEQIRAKIPGTQIIILSVQSDSNYLRRAMLAGARDFLTKPPDVDELNAAIRRAGQMAIAEKSKAAATAAVLSGLPGGGRGGVRGGGMPFGKIITIYAPKGGAGATTVTANLAVAIHSEDKPVVAVDGRLQFGDLSFFFNEQGRNNVTDLAPRANELDVDVVEEVLLKHKDTGIRILAAPPRPEQAEAVNGTQFGQVLSFLKTMYPYILVDTGSQLDEVTLAAIDNSDIIILLTTQDIPSIKNIRLFLDLANALGIQKNQLMMAMNRYDKRRSITPERVADISKQELSAVIPLEERLVVPAMDRGVPFLLGGRNNPVAKGITDLADALLKRIKELEEAESA